MRVRIIAVAIVATWISAALGADAKSKLHVYLPRTVKATKTQLTLADIGIIRGEAKDCVKAEAIPMGRAPFSKETIVIDRPTILSRLAAHGFPVGAVRLTGAQKVTIARDESIFPAADIVKAAEAFLAKHPPQLAGTGWRLVGRVAPLSSFGSAGTVALRVSAAKASPSGHLKLRVSAVSDGKKLNGVDVLFKLNYPHREAVTKTPVATGTKITKENTTVRTVRRDRPQKAQWTAPYGTVAARPLKAGAVLAPTSVRPPTPPTVVYRNRPVLMVIRGRGFVVTGQALALQDGRPGQFIRVRNVDSHRILVARVAKDGTVEPAVGR